MSQTLQNPFILQSLGINVARDEEAARAVADEPARAVATSPQPQAPRGRRSSPPRLQFKSPWEIEPPRYNPDGSENIDWARRQSALRLKTKWESIYERFKDAHLEDQDEIYLGRPGIDEPRIIRDRGSIRALSRQLRFGSFIRDEDLRAFGGDSDDDQSEGESDQDVFASPTRQVLPHLVEAPAGVEPENDDGPLPDLAVELDIYQSVKREAIESLLRTNTLGRTVPYDIPGLAERLGLHH
ncbi:hypothetical protein MCUN1_000850 [Malassezia cuniculi]|uniref:Uncharacterized protein n=1 Tax=Malassezia cuniculi TaxID=948313 RepID=A0AAF0ET20_9BASI|nr:hypothetical protein MCUN1_000850 [Malassezia cuniculi]